jgi:hypothetical protein
MIPEYKFYHGVVLAEIFDLYDGRVTVYRYRDSSRLLNYALNKRVGLQIKYATQRMTPWQFTYSISHINSLKELTEEFRHSFLVLVCESDGMICISANEILPCLLDCDNEQSWLRADRHKRKWYRLFSPAGEFPTKIPSGVAQIVEALS